jgi:hypothetical protein
MLNGETRRAPAPPDASSQTAWEKQTTPTNNPGPDQHSPLERLTPTQEKKEKKNTE